MKKILSIILALHASLFMLHKATAQIIHIPEDFPTIQQGIYSAANGDTILVQPGRYLERIDFCAKNITVGSLYLTTQDTGYITQTIIDADSTQGPVVNISGGQDSTAVICGFTVTGGTSGYKGGGVSIFNASPCLKNLVITRNTNWNGGGIAIENSKTVIQDVLICDNSAYNDYTGGSCCPDAAGGGIHCLDASPVLINVTISDNTVKSLRGSTTGGGIYCFRSNMILHNVTIERNVVDYRQDEYSGGGGGILCYDSTLYFSNVRITNNWAKFGGGICGGSLIIFDSLNRSDIYMNRACLGNDLYYTFGEIGLDTFTVVSPTEFHAYPIENYSFDILNGKLEQAKADLFVSPDGDNSNNGLSPEEPLQNAWCAFSKILVDSLHPHTIHLQEGKYSKSSNKEVFPIRMTDDINLSGESLNNVILDAEGLSSVLLLDNVNKTEITSLTLRGGVSRNGGGIELLSSNAVLKNIRVTGNTASWYQDENGGGIYIQGSGPLLENITIDSNYAKCGGGVYCCDGARPIFKNITIKNNIASEKGGGLFCHQSCPTFDSISRCNIYLNKAIWGNELYSDTTERVIVDTFTVIKPHEFHAVPFTSFAFDIIHGKLEQADADLYVSPWGNNANNGLTAVSPLKDIHMAISKIRADSLHQYTIHLLYGTYRTSVSGEFFPVNMPDYLNLKGESQSGCILDAEKQSTVILIENNTSNDISELTITGGESMEGGGICCKYSNPTLNDLTIKSNTGSPGGYGTIFFGAGGGVYCYYSNPQMKNLIISGNTAENGGGIFCDNSDPVFQNLILTDNKAHIHGEDGGGGLYCKNSNPIIKSAIISNNEASNGGGIFCVHSGTTVLNTQITGNNVCFGGNPNGGKGGGICCLGAEPALVNVTFSDNNALLGGAVFADTSSIPSIMNSILWDNSPYELAVDSIEILYSDVQGGWEAEGNINADPIFTGSGDIPFTLSAASPCVNTGNPDTTGFSLPPNDLLGNPRIWNERIDMGAYEWNNLGFEDHQGKNVNQWLSIYPNPAKDEVVVSVHSSQFAVGSRVSVTLYDLYGRQFKTLVDEMKSPGEYTMRINVADLSAGIYLVKLQVGNESTIEKLIVR
jgi:hypothetical protein